MRFKKFTAVDTCACFLDDYRQGAALVDLDKIFYAQAGLKEGLMDGGHRVTREFTEIRASGGNAIWVDGNVLQVIANDR